MSLATAGPPSAAPWFGAGGAEPWAASLGGNALGDAGYLDLVPEDPALGTERLDVRPWFTRADDADRTVLARLTDGPVLDVGCGPGRMVRAALDAGLPAYGVDVDPAAVAACRAQGLPVLRRSVFDPLPRTGAWAALLLLDGNVGIGGDVGALFTRCYGLLRPGGVVVAEAHPDPERDAAALWRLRGADGGTSAPFPWSQAGAAALMRAAEPFDVGHAWQWNSRCFITFLRPA